MSRRYISIWFRHLTTDWFSIRSPQLRTVPFVLRAPSHGRMVITAVNPEAEKKGIHLGMVLADARAIIRDLEVRDEKPELALKLLRRLAEWSIRFTPVVAVDFPDGLFFDASGCSHLWGGDEPYLAHIANKLNARGYDVRIAMADTLGVAWAIARFAKQPRDTACIAIPAGLHREALFPLPPEALRLERETVDRLHKLGLRQIRQFMNIPRPSLRRRFGAHLIMRLDMAMGQEIEMIEPVQPPEPYQERLSCMDPVVTGTGIRMVLEELLKTLCFRLQKEQKGLRTSIFKGYRVDGKVERVEIGTNRPTHHVHHLMKLFELKLSSIEPALGIELFILEAPKVEHMNTPQEKMWEGVGSMDDVRLSELIDRLAARLGANKIHRYLPDEHYLPERSLKRATSLSEQPATSWRADILRPLGLFQNPEPIEVTAPIPDYPPMLFRHKGKLHKIIRADGPERIEQEWWIEQGQHRDYYYVEDEEGSRYWIFRLGHYDEKKYQWFLHGFFG